MWIYQEVNLIQKGFLKCFHLHRMKRPKSCKLEITQNQNSKLFKILYCDPIEIYGGRPNFRKGAPESERETLVARHSRQNDDAVMFLASSQHFWTPSYA